MSPNSAKREFSLMDTRKHPSVIEMQGKPLLEKKSPATIYKLPEDMLFNIAHNFLDGQSLIKLSQLNRFFNKYTQPRFFIKKIHEEISQRPDNKALSNPIQYYQQATKLLSSIHLVLKNPTHHDFQQKLNNLFWQIIKKGYDKFVPLIIKKIKINAHLHLYWEGEGEDNSFMHLAAAYGRELILKELLLHGAYISPLTDGYVWNLGVKHGTWTVNTGLTPLMRAAQQGHAECMKILIEHHVALLLKNNAQLNRQEAINVVVNYQTICDRSTALHFAAFHGHLNCVTLLVENYHARVDLEDNYRRTALTCAKCNKHQATVEFLQHHMEENHIPIQQPASCRIL